MQRRRGRRVPAPTPGLRRSVAGPGSAAYFLRTTSTVWCGTPRSGVAEVGDAHGPGPDPAEAGSLDALPSWSRAVQLLPPVRISTLPDAGRRPLDGHLHGGTRLVGHDLLRGHLRGDRGRGLLEGHRDPHDRASLVAGHRRSGRRRGDRPGGEVHRRLAGLSSSVAPGATVLSTRKVPSSVVTQRHGDLGVLHVACTGHRQRRQVERQGVARTVRRGRVGRHVTPTACWELSTASGWSEANSAM